jgi:hypothetical protein
MVSSLVIAGEFKAGIAKEVDQGNVMVSQALNAIGSSSWMLYFAAPPLVFASPLIGLVNM